MTYMKNYIITYWNTGTGHEPYHQQHKTTHLKEQYTFAQVVSAILLCVSKANWHN